jgi:transcription initiation factor TFIIF subunit alpha
MSKQAKAMQKLIRNREGNEAYESDDDENQNPYASAVSHSILGEIFKLIPSIGGRRGGGGGGTAHIYRACHPAATPAG